MRGRGLGLGLVVSLVAGSVAGLAVSSPAVAGDETAVVGSVGQVAVTGAEPGVRLTLRDSGGAVQGRGRVDELGSLLFRDVPPGGGYRVEDVDGDEVGPTAAVLRADEHPPESFYAGQELEPGYGYLTTRDGTQLAVNVRLPGPPDDGPYPTVVEYSGYDAANPGGVQPASQLATALGYATVGVNMRGTGCSGGAWEYFEPLQALDGYDAVEAVAAQPWVQHGMVGMVGISFSGITQLFVGATQPPHLAAITPLSVIDDTYSGVLYPGGILNTGFALEWAEDRQDDARPAPDGGQRWARERVEEGDETCRANQALRLQTRDVLDVIEAHRFYDGSLDALNPGKLAERITAPTFVAGAWQDEQTGGHWPALIPRFSSDTKLRATIINGTHGEPFFPSIVTRWGEFLDFYVARRVPSVPALARASAGPLYAEAVGTPLDLPPDRFDPATDTYDTALARYEAEPPIRVLFDNGAGEPTGAPLPTFEASFEQWPPPDARATSLYLADRGRLVDEAPDRAGIDEYAYDPGANPRTSHPSSDDDLFEALPDYDWQAVPDGDAVAYVSAPLTEDTVVLGPGSVDLWLRSSARDVDLEVALTEVRPDGKETYVQSGWLRASRRALDDAASTELAPVPTYAESDAAPLPGGRFTPVRVPLFPVGHAFRAGSRIRLVVQAPGGNRPLWAFDALDPDGDVTNEIARGDARPSRIVLSVVPDVDVSTPLPPCPALRGQPCRDYTP